MGIIWKEEQKKVFRDSVWLIKNDSAKNNLQKYDNIQRQVNISQYISVKK